MKNKPANLVSVGFLLNLSAIWCAGDSPDTWDDLRTLNSWHVEENVEYSSRYTYLSG